MQEILSRIYTYCCYSDIITAGIIWILELTTLIKLNKFNVILDIHNIILWCYCKLDPRWRIGPCKDYRDFKQLWNLDGCQISWWLSCIILNIMLNFRADCIRCSKCYSLFFRCQKRLGHIKKQRWELIHNSFS